MVVPRGAWDDGGADMAGVMWFETSDTRYWAKLPATIAWFPIMARIVAMACWDYRITESGEKTT